VLGVVVPLVICAARGVAPGLARRFCDEEPGGSGGPIRPGGTKKNGSLILSGFPGG
jgi:hypothetical protein